MKVLVDELDNQSDARVLLLSALWSTSPQIANTTGSERKPLGNVEDPLTVYFSGLLNTKVHSKTIRLIDTYSTIIA